MEVSPCDDCDLDDCINLESKVLKAFSRLQKNKQSLRKSGEVSCQNIVKFLKSNYCWLDGDIESQVMTALLSCIKSGVVCALNNGLYRLIGPNSKTMAKKCVTRISHGPKCSCLERLNIGLKLGARICCFVKNTDSPGSRVKRTTKTRARKKTGSSATKRGNTPKKKCAPKRKQKKKCQQELDLEKKISLKLSKTEIHPKCEYCHECHPVPNTTNPCPKCTEKSKPVMPACTFSPRDEFD